MNNKNKLVSNIISKRSALAGMLLVFVAALTLEATSLVQYIFARRGLEAEASNRAETQIEATHNNIMDIINQAEAAVRNSMWVAQWSLAHTDSLHRICERIVGDNPVIMGSTVALVPGYDSRHPLLAPYCCRTCDTLTTLSLATQEYDYPAQEWFVKPIECGGGYWSEPYVDTGGGEVLMTTYSVPILDQQGQTAAVLTGDISLEWLISMMGNIKIYPHATSLMISRQGKWMMNHDMKLVTDQTILEVVEQIRDHDDFKKLQQAMLSGESGNILISYKNMKRYVYYAPVERTGWSMCIIIPHEDIFGGVRKTNLIVVLMQLLGLAMLILILRSIVRSQNKFRDLNERKRMMENELHIASNIQMSMVPKVFPPYPERNDLDMAADIVPAKEIGGDMYDYFMRDNKLFFCIGDVSGKGIPAALVMAVTRSIFRTVAAHEDSPSAIVTSMNDSLSDMNENSMFVTFFCGVLDMETGHIKYCNAGHNPPLILTDSIKEIPVKPNLPLGIAMGMTFEEQETDMNYDDALFLYTDGLSEAENIAHEQFGMERIETALHGHKKSEMHLKNMQNEVEKFVGNAPQSDDLTMLFIHYLGEDRRPAANHRLTLANEVGEISRLSAFIESIAEEYNLSSSLLAGINLAMEEAVTNVILYAYPEDTPGHVEICCDKQDNALTFVVADKGKPFDPTLTPPVDITLGAEDRRIGGLGIHLVRTIMDSVKYARENDMNILTLTKNI